MTDFTKVFAPIMLAEEITIKISRSDYGRISSGEDAYYEFEGINYRVFYDGANDRYYFYVGDTMYILETYN